MNANKKKEENTNFTHLHNEVKLCKDNFISFIQSRLGIVIHKHQLNELEKTIMNACHKFHCSPKEYLTILNECSVQATEMEFLISGVTVGESYFFRDKHQMTLLQKTILPTLIKHKLDNNNLTLRIWSAGCSSGEEIYTIAMMLYEMLPNMSAWHINLLATDINAEMLAKAMTGKYSEWSMRSISPYFKKTYFAQQNNSYLLKKEIVGLVKFDHLNLHEDNYPAIFNGTNAQDLILCRNVLIYFDSEQITHIMKKFSACLTAEGYLLLGASDPVRIKDTQLIFHHDMGLVFSHEAPHKIPMEVKTEEPHKQPLITPVQRDKIIHHTHKVMPIVPKKIGIINENEILSLVKAEKWHELLTLINSTEISYAKNKPLPVFLLNTKALALANLGKLEESAKYYQNSLLINSTNKHTYFNYALVLLELNQFTEAEKCLKKSIFLDHEFVSAHYQLGLLLLRNKMHAAGIKSLRNALTIVKTKKKDHLVPEFPGLNYGRLTELLQYEIDLYSDASLTT